MNDINSCVFCGRYVLQVPGWTTYLESYRMVRSPWDAENSFLTGAFHHSCLRTFAHRAAFREDALKMLTSGDHDIMIVVDGKEITHQRPGMAFTEPVFSGESGDLFRHVNIDSWVFIEKGGPFHFFRPDEMNSLARNGVVRMSTGGYSTLLPRKPDGPVEQWSFARLLDFLEIRDLYQDVLDRLNPEYQFWEYVPNPPKFHLDYTVDCDQPLPQELIQFCSTYTYRPRSLDWE